MKLSYATIVSYLRAKGWKYLETVDEIELWSFNFGDEQYHLTLPLKGSDSQYCGETLSVVGYTENRTVDEVKTDIIK